MKAVFFEASTFTATVGSYLADDEYRQLQSELLANPQAGDVMPRTGGFRKLRWSDGRRGKGKRGGLRVIYYWLLGDGQFWMFAIYDKDELGSLRVRVDYGEKSTLALRFLRFPCVDDR